MAAGSTVAVEVFLDASADGGIADGGIADGGVAGGGIADGGVAGGGIAPPPAGGPLSTLMSCWGYCWMEEV
jgi:hypothetical protein